jgi:hypothetical protein
MLVTAPVEAAALRTPHSRDEASGWVKWRNIGLRPLARRLYSQMATGVDGSIAERL